MSKKPRYRGKPTERRARNPHPPKDRCIICRKPAPFVVTHLPKPDGTLTVTFLCSNPCAVRARLPWAATPLAF